MLSIQEMWIWQITFNLQLKLYMPTLHALLLRKVWIHLTLSPISLERCFYWHVTREAGEKCSHILLKCNSYDVERRYAQPSNIYFSQDAMKDLNCHIVDYESTIVPLQYSCFELVIKRTIKPHFPIETHQRQHMILCESHTWHIYFLYLIQEDEILRCHHHHYYYFPSDFFLTKNKIFSRKYFFLKN